MLDPLAAPQRPWILDGGLATALEDRGYDLHPDLWSGGVFLERPEAVAEVHRSYLEAGAEIVIGASYQMTFAGLARAGLDEPAAARALRGTVELARETCASVRPRALVAASVGPYGASRADGSEYRGDYDLDTRALVAFHRQRFDVLASAGADLLACETIPTLYEAEALLELLVARPRARAWFSFSCRDGTHLAAGHPIRDAARLVDGSTQVIAVGVNCTAPRYVSSLCENIRAVSTKPLVVYPNSGESWDPGGRRWAGARSSDAFVRSAHEWARMGAFAIGGCCRIGPEEIRALAASWPRAGHRPAG
jgi:homocysteine S-methyltransferase